MFARKVRMSISGDLPDRGEKLMNTESPSNTTSTSNYMSTLNRLGNSAPLNTSSHLSRSSHSKYSPDLNRSYDSVRRLSFHPSLISSLHKEAVKIASELEAQEFLMLEVLQKIDEKKIYRYMGFRSLFQYATVALGLSESRAYNFIIV